MEYDLRNVLGEALDQTEMVVPVATSQTTSDPPRESDLDSS
jgi:hypothetical protein